MRPAAGSLFRAIPGEGQECLGPGDAVAVGSRRCRQAGVAPFPGEDSGTRFPDIARFREDLAPFCPARAGSLGRAGAHARYLAGQWLSDVTAAEHTYSAEVRSILPDAARDQAQRHVRNKRSSTQRRRLARPQPWAPSLHYLPPPFTIAFLPHRERRFSRLPLPSTLWGAPSSHACSSLLGSRRSEGSPKETDDGEGWGLREGGVM